MSYEAECPYCLRIFGSSPRSAFDRILNVGPGAVLVPTLGMLTPGYLLVVAEDHEPSFSYWQQQALDELDGYVNAMIRRLEPVFGEYVVFEHGPGRPRSMGSGSCIDHAHLHLIPASKGFSGRISTSFAWNPMPSLSALCEYRAEPYALARLSDTYYVAPAADLPSQWIRRQLADMLGAIDRWDWRSYSGHSELEQTLASLVGVGFVANEAR